MIPVPGYAVGTPYGRRGPYWSCSPDAYGNGIHTGVDYPAPVGTRVVAARGGKVVYCNHGSAFGYHQLEILPGDGTRDFYAHMTTRAPADGSHVDAGATVGKVGAEGNVTGAHLHFERHGVASGGWSCAVVRDPAPSINYQPASGSGGAGAGGKDDDMPEFGAAKTPKAQKLEDGKWEVVAWKASAGDCWDKQDPPGILLGGRHWVMTLTARVSGRKGGTVQTRIVGRKGGEVVWEAPHVTHDKDFVTDTRVGKSNDGVRTRVQILCNGPATLEVARVSVVYW